MSDVIARLRERMDDTARAGIYWIYVKQHEIEPLLDVAEAARAWREAERGDGSGQPISAQRIMETQIALYVALDRLKADGE